MAIVALESIRSLTGRYRTFLLDQFGVLHDGYKPYPNTIDGLCHIAASGSRAIIISNSGKRSAINQNRLTELGIPPQLYQTIVTSGEVAYEELQRQIHRGVLPARAACFLFANDNDTSAIDGLNLTMASKIDEADFILLSGVRGNICDMDYYTKLLAKPLARNIPMICTNPDKLALYADKRVMGAGMIAEHYENAGGTVQWIGKPYPAIYQAILRRENLVQNTEQVICIGDSIEHDIAGGQTQQLATVLVKTGVHTNATDDQLKEKYQQFDAKPDYIMPAFG